jgi:hypothetical protein
LFDGYYRHTWKKTTSTLSPLIYSHCGQWRSSRLMKGDNCVRVTKRIVGHISVVSDYIFVCLSVCLWKDCTKCARICVGDSWLNTTLKSSRKFSENSAEVQLTIFRKQCWSSKLLSENSAEIQKKTIFRKQCWSTAEYFPKTLLKYSRIFSENSAEVQQTIFRKTALKYRKLFSEKRAEVQQNI